MLPVVVVPGGGQACFRREPVELLGGRREDALADLMEQVKTLGALLQQTDDPEEFGRIKEQFDKAAAAARKIIAANIEAQRAEYEQVTEALQGSVNALKSAKESGETLAGRITQVAAVVDRIAQLASKVT